MLAQLRKIDFRQPKYIFPLVFAVPSVALLYLLTNLFGTREETGPTDFINTDLPEANVDGSLDKLGSMESRYSKSDDLFSAVDGFDTERQEKESLDQEYSEEEIQRLMRDAEMRQRQQEAAEMQASMGRSASRMDSHAGRGSYDSGYDVDSELDAIYEKQRRRLRSMTADVEPDYEPMQAPVPQVATQQPEEPVHEVVKASSPSRGHFNSVAANPGNVSDSPLIRAMIDRTTKSTDGTRLRFKLLDDVIIGEFKLLKGAYIYGTVTGFGSQRVKASITSLLVGDKFMKINLNVYDVDGMEGFYVPESSFREFMQDAASAVAGQNIQISNNSSGTGINPEMLALQALQNVYQAGSSAISKNVKKNKATIKYNTIVYLINASNVQ